MSSECDFYLSPYRDRKGVLKCRKVRNLFDKRNRDFSQSSKTEIEVDNQIRFEREDSSDVATGKLVLWDGGLYLKSDNRYSPLEFEALFEILRQDDRKELLERGRLFRQHANVYWEAMKMGFDLTEADLDKREEKNAEEKKSDASKPKEAPRPQPASSSNPPDEDDEIQVLGEIERNSHQSPSIRLPNQNIRSILRHPLNQTRVFSARPPRLPSNHGPRRPLDTSIPLPRRPRLGLNRFSTRLPGKRFLQQPAPTSSNSSPTEVLPFIPYQQAQMTKKPRLGPIEPKPIVPVNTPRSMRPLAPIISARIPLRPEMMRPRAPRLPPAPTHPVTAYWMSVSEQSKSIFTSLCKKYDIATSSWSSPVLKSFMNDLVFPKTKAGTVSWSTSCYRFDDSYLMRDKESALPEAATPRRIFYAQIQDAAKSKRKKIPEFLVHGNPAQVVLSVSQRLFQILYLLTHYVEFAEPVPEYGLEKVIEAIDDKAKFDILLQAVWRIYGFCTNDPSLMDCISIHGRDCMQGAKSLADMMDWVVLEQGAVAEAAAVVPESALFYLSLLLRAILRIDKQIPDEDCRLIHVDEKHGGIQMGNRMKGTTIKRYSIGEGHVMYSRAVEFLKFTIASNYSTEKWTPFMRANALNFLLLFGASVFKDWHDLVQRPINDLESHNAERKVVKDRLQGVKEDYIRMRESRVQYSKMLSDREELEKKVAELEANRKLEKDEGTTDDGGTWADLDVLDDDLKKKETKEQAENVEKSTEASTESKQPTTSLTELKTQLASINFSIKQAERETDAYSEKIGNLKSLLTELKEKDAKMASDEREYLDAAEAIRSELVLLGYDREWSQVVLAPNIYPGLLVLERDPAPSSTREIVANMLMPKGVKIAGEAAKYDDNENPILKSLSPSTYRHSSGQSDRDSEANLAKSQPEEVAKMLNLYAIAANKAPGQTSSQYKCLMVEVQQVRPIDWINNPPDVDEAAQGLAQITEEHPFCAISAIDCEKSLDAVEGYKRVMSERSGIRDWSISQRLEQNMPTLKTFVDDEAGASTDSGGSAAVKSQWKDELMQKAMDRIQLGFMNLIPKNMDRRIGDGKRKELYEEEYVAMDRIQAKLDEARRFLLKCDASTMLDVIEGIIQVIALRTADWIANMRNSKQRDAALCERLHQLARQSNQRDAVAPPPIRRLFIDAYSRVLRSMAETYAEVKKGVVYEREDLEKDRWTVEDVSANGNEIENGGSSSENADTTPLPPAVDQIDVDFIRRCLSEEESESQEEEEELVVEPAKPAAVDRPKECIKDYLIPTNGHVKNLEDSKEMSPCSDIEILQE